LFFAKLWESSVCGNRLIRVDLGRHSSVSQPSSSQCRSAIEVKAD
jgi:hypothetical protein